MILDLILTLFTVEMLMLRDWSLNTCCSLFIKRAVVFVLFFGHPITLLAKVVSHRPDWDEPVALDKALEQHQEKVREMISSPKTHIYVAGVENIDQMLEKSFSKMAGSKEKWER